MAEQFRRDRARQKARRTESAEPRRARHAGRRALRRPLTRRANARAYRASAQQHLRRFRQGSALAVAVTAMLLLLWGAPVPVEGQDAVEPTAATEPTTPGSAPLPDASAAVDQAAGTVRDLAYNFYGFLPRLLLVLVLFAIAVLAARFARALLERSLPAWQRTAAIGAIVRLLIFLVAAIAAVSILAGDVRAIVGSVGLLGLAASWALQTPIESFTGWLLNAFRSYYRVGDRIAVGDVFGDVYRIDVLTTTVWEAGGPGKSVTAAQPTGALVTFPNWEILRSNITNYSRDFPYVWDEVTTTVANESDLGYCAEVLAAVARRTIGDQMEDAAQRYERLLRSRRITHEVEELPKVYFGTADSWTECTLRYLVPVRARRKLASNLILEISRELAKPEHRGRILPVYPRREIVTRESWGSGVTE